jgi:hypothetical protein
VGEFELIKILGEVRDGKFIPDTPQYFKAAVSEHEGKRIEVWIGRESVRRGVKFNRAYFGALVQAFAEYTGYTHEEAHAIIKQDFMGLPYQEKEYGGKLIVVEPRTRYDNEKEFKSKVSDAERRMFEEGIIQVMNFQE